MTSLSTSFRPRSSWRSKCLICEYSTIWQHHDRCSGELPLPLWTSRTQSFSNEICMVFYSFFYLNPGWKRCKRELQNASDFFVPRASPGRMKWREIKRWIQIGGYVSNFQVDSHTPSGILVSHYSMQYWGPWRDLDMACFPPQSSTSLSTWAVSSLNLSIYTYLFSHIFLICKSGVWTWCLQGDLHTMSLEISHFVSRRGSRLVQKLALAFARNRRLLRSRGIGCTAICDRWRCRAARRGAAAVPAVCVRASRTLEDEDWFWTSILLWRTGWTCALAACSEDFAQGSSLYHHHKNKEWQFC